MSEVSKANLAWRPRVKMSPTPQYPFCAATPPGNSEEGFNRCFWHPTSDGVQHLCKHCISSNTVQQECLNICVEYASIFKRGGPWGQRTWMMDGLEVVPHGAKTDSQPKSRIRHSTANDSGCKHFPSLTSRKSGVWGRPDSTGTLKRHWNSSPLLGLILKKGVLIKS